MAKDVNVFLRIIRFPNELPSKNACKASNKSSLDSHIVAAEFCMFLILEGNVGKINFEIKRKPEKEEGNFNESHK